MRWSARRGIERYSFVYICLSMHYDVTSRQWSAYWRLNSFIRLAALCVLVHYLLYLSLIMLNMLELTLHVRLLFTSSCSKYMWEVRRRIIWMIPVFNHDNCLDINNRGSLLKVILNKNDGIDLANLRRKIFIQIFRSVILYRVAMKLGSPVSHFICKHKKLIC